MRKAYVGLSTPIGYNYEFESAITKPNPILDSPWGLFLFYDEIWFLDRALCPLNCQNLNYIHFLNEEYNLEGIDINDYCKELKRNRSDKYDTIISKSHLSLLEILALNLGDGYDLIDNHGRGMKIGKMSLSFNSDVDNLLIDSFIANYFGLELITNTYINQFLSNDIDPFLRATLTQSVLVDNIPNIQLPEGPYHPLIEDLRSEELLAYFRNKINEVTTGAYNQDIDELKASLNKQMEIYKDDLVIKSLSKHRLYKSALDATTAQVPILSNLYSGVDFIRNITSFTDERKNNGWVGFTVKARQAINNNK